MQSINYNTTTHDLLIFEDPQSRPEYFGKSCHISGETMHCTDIAYMSSAGDVVFTTGFVLFLVILGFAIGRCTR